MKLIMTDTESFIEEIKAAGVKKVYTTYITESKTNEYATRFRSKFKATAMGLTKPFEAADRDGEQITEKTLLILETDFGPVNECLLERKIPKEYREKVMAKGQETIDLIKANGFEVGSGEIVDL